MFYQNIYYNITDTKQKQATAKQAFVFVASVSEQTSDEIGQRARKRGFASFGASAKLRVQRKCTSLRVYQDERVRKETVHE